MLVSLARENPNMDWRDVETLVYGTREHPVTGDTISSAEFGTSVHQCIEDKVNESLSEIQYEVPFKMTTCWFNRVRVNHSLREHYHTNSFWSSVFYFSKSTYDTSITFVKPTQQINPRSNTILY